MEAVQFDGARGPGARRSDDTSGDDRNHRDGRTGAGTGDPNTVGAGADGGEGPADGRERTTAAYLGGAGDDDGDGGAGWRAWLLVGATFVALLVVPAAILVLPAARPVIAAFGLTYRDAYLVLPLVPALVLAALAVWVGVANRRR